MGVVVPAEPVRAELSATNRAALVRQHALRIALEGAAVLMDVVARAVRVRRDSRVWRVLALLRVLERRGSHAS